MTNIDSGDEGQSLKRELAVSLFGAVALADGQSYLAAIPAGSNILGFGLGAKTTASAVLDETAVRVYVREKLPSYAVGKGEAIPSSINGVPTDVIAVGEIIAYARPTPAGVSGAHVRLPGSGTLGCLVDRNGSGKFILSNNHVMALENAASIGDDILEPSMGDSGGTATPIATLTDFEKIRFGGAKNSIDAATAELINQADMTPDIRNIGRVTPASITPVKKMPVMKNGRTTGLTSGFITDVAADIQVRYHNGQLADFEDQIAVQALGSGLFSQPGDSGSLIVESTQKRPVALLFAGGGLQTFGNPINLVLARFRATVL